MRSCSSFTNKKELIMKRFLTIITTIAITAIIAVSCYYDSEESLYPELTTSCDTLTVTFTATIVPILNNNCYSCHSNTTAASSGNNIKLQNYADVVTNATAITGSINHTGTWKPMPKNGGKIKACSLKQFDIWVAAGKQNN
jgi:hypothetical protein